MEPAWEVCGDRRYDAEREIEDHRWWSISRKGGADFGESMFSSLADAIASAAECLGLEPGEPFLLGEVWGYGERPAQAVNVVELKAT